MSFTGGIVESTLLGALCACVDYDTSPAKAIPWLRADIMISVPETRPVRMPIGFEASQYEWLREYAHRRRVTMAAVVREAVDRLRADVDPQLSLPIETPHSRMD